MCKNLALFAGLIGGFGIYVLAKENIPLALGCIAMYVISMWWTNN